MKSRIIASASICGLLLVMFLGLHFYNQGMDSGKYREIEYVIGVSQANMRESWRLALTSEIEEEAKKHKNIRLIMTDATSDVTKQVKDVEKLIDFGIDLLIISPCDTEIMTSIIRGVYHKEIPVIVMDRGVEGFDYSLFIGPDNEQIGRRAGEGVLRLLEDEEGKVLEICQSEDSLPSQNRSKGFDSIISKYSKIEKSVCRIESGSKDDAEDTMLAMGEHLKDYDVIFAHNDYMALGAYLAMDKIGADAKIVGIDGFLGENEGIDLITQGKIEETITCPTGGKEAIQYALDILKQVSGVPKQVILRSHVVTKDNVESYIAGLNETYKKPDKIIDVGYAQVGMESAWRKANTESIKEAAKDFGMNLIFEDADQSQQMQIDAIRKFIKMNVDVIVVSPVVDSGWDEILKETKAAGIPVLASDRKIAVQNDDWVMTYIGSDFLEEGRRAMRWIRDNVPAVKDCMKIMELQGNEGASPTEERKQGFEEILKENGKYKIVYSEYGDFTIEGGRDIIKNYLASHEWDIDIIYAQNDDMAIGAIEELEKNGIAPGVDVKIVSVDGTREAFEAMIDGKLNCAVECNPLLGPQLMKAIQDLVAGKELPLRIITEEKWYDQSMAKEYLRSRKY